MSSRDEWLEFPAENLRPIARKLQLLHVDAPPTEKTDCVEDLLALQNHWLYAAADGIVLCWHYLFERSFGSMVEEWTLGMSEEGFWDAIDKWNSVEHFISPRLGHWPGYAARIRSDRKKYATRSEIIEVNQRAAGVILELADAIDAPLKATGAINIGIFAEWPEIEQPSTGTLERLSRMLTSINRDSPRLELAPANTKGGDTAAAIQSSDSDQYELKVGRIVYEERSSLTLQQIKDKHELTGSDKLLRDYGKHYAKANGLPWVNKRPGPPAGQRKSQAS